MSKEGTGTVKWFNGRKGFGFIEQEQGEDLFVHFRDIKGEGYLTLKSGEKVTFEIADGEKGLHAKNVNIIS